MIEIIGLDDQFTLRGRITTIRAEMDVPNRANVTLIQDNKAPECDRYRIAFSKRAGDRSDTREWGLSKADFEYLRQQGITSAL